MESSIVNIDDFVKFAAVAYRLSAKKGYLLNRDVRQYFCLYGGLLYCFEREDPASLVSLIFLESATVKAAAKNLGNGFGISIATVGGKFLTLFANSADERQEWLDAFESYKFITMCRKAEDSEASSVQNSHRVEQQENQIVKLEIDLSKKKDECNKIMEKVRMLDGTIKNQDNEINNLRAKIKDLEYEKMMLLKSKGITPKAMPTWSLRVGGKDKKDDSPDILKIWVGTWNLAGADPFAGVERDRARKMLQPFVPTGYDIYALGVQDCIGDSLFETTEALLSGEGCYRLQSNSQDECLKIFGRGDGSIVSQTFTGLALFINRKIASGTRLLATAQMPLSSLVSRGGVAAALNVFGRTMVFVSSHFDACKVEVKRTQYQSLVVSLGEQLAESGFNLNEQFHHVIWCGDLNYSLVDTSGNQLPVDTAVEMLESNLNRTLFDSHDQLNQERKGQMAFYGYREPTPFPNFFPTYKKNPNRTQIDYSNKKWVQECYRIKKKEPFYKGGSVKEFVPSFNDRVLYHSMVDLAEDLIPECVDHDMDVHISDKYIDSMGGVKGPFGLSTMIDNYQAINDGEIFTVSDHSPVFGTFLLRLTHDHDQLKRDMTDRIGSSQGNIHSIFSALADDPNPNPTSALTSPSKSPRESDHNNNNNNIPRSLSTSLLPPGAKKITISNIRLMWAAQEDIPVSMRVQFPVPYETVCGEKCVQFSGEVSGNSNNNNSNNSNNNIDNNNIRGVNSSSWKKVGESRSGTTCQMEIDTIDRVGLGQVAAVGNPKPTTVTPLQIVWTGEEPLDKLHMAIQATIPSIVVSSSRPMSSRIKSEEVEYCTGHCAFGLEQLCKVALVSSGGLKGSVNIARLLTKGGLPMTVNDFAGQKEKVTFCCTLELLAL